MLGFATTAALAIGFVAVFKVKFSGMSSAIQQIRERNAHMVLAGKRAVVVGGTSGLGEAVARRLAKAQVSVTIVGRSQKGHEIVKQLAELGGSDHAFHPCDCFLVKNAATLGDELNQKYGKIDFLVLSQGMATIQGRTETPEGIDQKLALHYFGRMAFIDRLLPSLRAGSGGKVLSVLSGGVHGPFAHYEDDFELVSHYSIKNAADAAGFYNDLGLDGLSRQPENANVLFLHMAPGFVRTNWGTEMPAVIRYLVRGIQLFAKPAEDAGEALASPLFEMDGAGFFPLNEFGAKTNVTSLHSDKAIDFVRDRTQAVLQRALEK